MKGYTFFEQLWAQSESMYKVNDVHKNKINGLDEYVSDKGMDDGRGGGEGIRKHGVTRYFSVPPFLRRVNV